MNIQLPETQWVQHHRHLCQAAESSEATRINPVDHLYHRLQGRRQIIELQLLLHHRALHYLAERSHSPSLAGMGMSKDLHQGFRKNNGTEVVGRLKIYKRMGIRD